MIPLDQLLSTFNLITFTIILLAFTLTTVPNSNVFGLQMDGRSVVFSCMTGHDHCTRNNSNIDCT